MRVKRAILLRAIILRAIILQIEDHCVVGIDQAAAATWGRKVSEHLWHMRCSVARAASASITGTGFVAVSTAGIRQRDHVPRPTADTGAMRTHWPVLQHI